MSNEKNKLKFATVGELLAYRDIHVQAVAVLNASERALTEAESATLIRHKDYLLITDLFLHDAFFSTAKEKLTEGIQIDPVLYPSLDMPKFMQATELFRISTPDAIQQRIGFEEEVKIPIDAAVKKPSTSEGMPLEKVISLIFKDNGNEIISVVNSAKIYASKNGIDYEKEGLIVALRAFLADPKFKYVNNFAKLKFASRYMLELLIQHKTPVHAMLMLKMKYFDANPMEVGEVFAFLCEFGFNTHKDKDGKFKGWTWKNFDTAMNSVFRVVIDEKDIVMKSNDEPREKVEKDTLCGALVVRDKLLSSSIFNDEDIKKKYFAYVQEVKDSEKKKLFFNDEQKLRDDIYYRTIEECLSYGSPIRRESIQERRLKQMTGESPKKPYKEGDSGYSKSAS